MIDALEGRRGPAFRACLGRHGDAALTAPSGETGHLKQAPPGFLEAADNLRRARRQTGEGTEGNVTPAASARPH
jgi:hypothetical protein